MIIKDENSHTFETVEGHDALLFSWKSIHGLEIDLFRQAVIEFAQLCLQHRPSRGIIDAQQLDQTSSAVAWLRGSMEGQAESYDTWWAHEILPIYVEAGVEKLAVATGDPNAPGEVPTPEDHPEFRMGYFHELEDAYAW